MQYLFPVGVGPSLKTCPRWPWHFLHSTSVFSIPWERSFFSSTFSVFAGLSKEGQPVPDSNLVSEENNSVPQPEQTYIPFFLLWTNFPVNGISVPFSLNTLYCSGVSFSLHSSSDFGIWAFMNKSLLLLLITTSAK